MVHFSLTIFGSSSTQRILAIIDPEQSARQESNASLKL
jgi:hypothetical protein